jgi:hypothetical protein
MEIIKLFLMYIFLYYFVHFSLVFKMLFIFSSSLLTTFYSNKNYYEDNKDTSIVNKVSDIICRYIYFFSVLIGSILNYVKNIWGISYLYQGLELINSWYVKGKNILLSKAMGYVMKLFIPSNIEYKNLDKPKENKRLFKDDTEMLDFLNNLENEVKKDN